MKVTNNGICGVVYYLIVARTAFAFVSTPTTTFGRSSQYYLSADAEPMASLTSTLSLSLEKPLGMVLEEAEEENNNNSNTAGGVFVKALAETGSAVPYADQLLGVKLLSVGGVSVTTATFETVMDLIIQTEGTVTIEFDVASDATKAPRVELAIGTPVIVTVQQGNSKPDLILNTNVGDNLRKVLLDSGFEVYQGIKQKLGNCGGAGQCTFCAVDFIESEGWAERSNYEDIKLEKYPAARLACLNNIQGPLTICKTQR